MYTCANCNQLACAAGTRENLPSNCPMRQEQKLWEIFNEYQTDDNHRFYVTSSSMEAAGYGQWPRLRETIEFCKAMGYQRVGIAFCKGLRKEARVVAGLLQKHHFQVVSVICKTGGISKEAAGIPEENKLHPHEFEAMCNPIAQAALLNEQQTEFNIAIGLCVGHDSLFYQYSKAPVTTLIAKDRVLAHNPCGAIYCVDGYFKNKLG